MDTYMQNLKEELANNPFLVYDRTDRNGTLYYWNYRCGKCGGRGLVPYRVDNGVCWDCGGSGRREKPQVAKYYTPEHEEELRVAREARNLKKKNERQEKFKAELPAYLSKFGFGTEGEDLVIYAVKGNTYSVKETLKEMGCRFNPSVGWYSSTPLDGFETQRFVAADVMDFNFDACTFDWKLKGSIKFETSAASPSQFQGEIGDRIKRVLKVKSVYEYDGYYGCGNIYTFVDEVENIYVWSTSAATLKVDVVYDVVGTVKEHKVFKDVNETVLTRCKCNVVEAA